MTPTMSQQQLKKLAEMGQKRAIAALEFSLQNGYTGIFEPRENASGKPTIEADRAAREEARRDTERETEERNRRLAERDSKAARPGVEKLRQQILKVAETEPEDDEMPF